MSQPFTLIILMNSLKNSHAKNSNSKRDAFSYGWSIPSTNIKVVFCLIIFIKNSVLNFKAMR